ncbi:hypothetical protein FACS1894181_10910 [Bacteroidia bacterium]|nr:hypothetical protein FACS1894181_10910 [Bacteroidia bacterium]
MDGKIEQLQQELAATLRKARRNRKALTVSRILCYGAALAYFAFIAINPVLLSSTGGSLFTHDYALNPNPTFWETNKILVFIIPVFILITIGGLGISFFHKKFATAEQRSVRRITGAMFPDAKCYIETRSLRPSLLRSSYLFGESGQASSFGSIVFDRGGLKLEVEDIIVQANNGFVQTQLGGTALLLKTLFAGLSGKRLESMASSFRGLFAHTQLAKDIQGSIVILPDHLERRLDYLAQMFQSMKNISGNRLVKLEDIEFEQYFAVYSTDEIMARYVLTPAMMLRMTALRKKYNRDIMLSFNGSQFFFAVAMPEGFLTLGSNAVHPGTAINDLYENIETARTILRELKLDKAPEREIRL